MPFARLVSAGSPEHNRDPDQDLEHRRGERPDVESNCVEGQAADGHGEGPAAETDQLRLGNLRRLVFFRHSGTDGRMPGIYRAVGAQLVAAAERINSPRWLPTVRAVLSMKDATARRPARFSTPSGSNQKTWASHSWGSPTAGSRRCRATLVCASSRSP